MIHKLPVGIQDFESLRNENYVYVDKTQLIHQMITQGRVYFLSRPRRFGKSLLISTLHAIFRGKRHLFKDLWIDSSDYSWEEYPVIWLSMSAAVISRSAELLQQSLNEQLDKIAKPYGIELAPSVSVAGRLDNLILQLAENNKKVVVLIDEYDKPLIDQIHRPEIALGNLEILREFYGVLKDRDANIRFVFLTGVSKFTKVSIFSGLNNLRDISLSNEYATLLGYTQQELTSYFSLEIDSLAQQSGLSRPELLDKIKHWYNGYRFSKEDISVYNPFSTLLLFTEQDFSDYWFETATPTFLVNLLQEQQYDITKIDNLAIGAASFSSYEIDKLNPLPLLYQTGYLTIKSYNQESGIYELGYPNLEVERAFLQSLLAGFSKVKDPAVQDDAISKMVTALKELSFDTFFQLFKDFLTSIPYDLYKKYAKEEEQVKEEKYYQTIFFLVFKLLGIRIGTEVHTNRGRKWCQGSALTLGRIESKDAILIFGVSGQSPDTTAKEALQQIKEKGYAEQYRTQPKAVYLVGLNFDSEQRNVNDYAVEQLG